ncbi:hypothetical protein [Nonomuraea sp. NPDC002799]
MSRRTRTLPVILGVALAAVSVAVPPAAAAGRGDPVAALKRQLNGPGGVRIVTSSTARSPSENFGYTFKARAIYEFRDGKVVAIDFTVPKSASDDGQRIIEFPDRGYNWQQDPPDYLPIGKSWIVGNKRRDLYLQCDQMVLSDPATLRHLLGTTTAKRGGGTYDGTRTTLYEGTTTIGALYKLNPRLRVNSYLDKPTGPHAGYAKLPVRWRLWIGRDLLVRRCQTRYDEPVALYDTKNRTFRTADVRLSGWGQAISIKPPPADQVATVDELVFSDD